MRTPHASITKVRGVLEVATRDQSWASLLANDPEAAIHSAGIDLTAQELAAVKDIVLGTKESRYATPPPGWPDMYPDLQEVWSRAKVAKKQ